MYRIGKLGTNSIHNWICKEPQIYLIKRTHKEIIINPDATTKCSLIIFLKQRTKNETTH